SIPVVRQPRPTLFPYTTLFRSKNQPIRKLDYLSECVYLTENARYNYLLNLPEEASLGKSIDNAMKSIEAENEELKDVLPKNYVRSEEHTSELQSRENLVCRLLL